MDAAIGVTRQLNIDLNSAMLQGEGLTEAVGWLATIRHRLSLVGGQLQIEAAPGEGAHITISAPLQLKSD